MVTFEVQRHDDTFMVVLALHGDLDLYSSPALDDALVELEGEKWPLVVLDLRDLEFVDSSGLRLFARTHARAAKDGRRLVLVRGNEVVQRVLALTGLDREIEVRDALPVGAPEG